MKLKNIHLYFIMVAGMITWGVSWPAAKVVGRYGDPNDLIVWRFVLAILTMLININSYRSVHTNIFPETLEKDISSRDQ